MCAAVDGAVLSPVGSRLKRTGGRGVRCQACHSENAEGNRFCGSCGSAIIDPLDAAATSVQIPATVGMGRYRTVRLLGEGARKRVYLAMDERLVREVAVAVVKTEGLDANGRVRVTREAQAMARLGDDPAIVTVYDVGEEADGTPFIVSQFMAGGSLDEHLDREPNRRFPVRRALQLTEQLARGLAHAHELQIVHRDLKPANVWLDAGGAARLGDFGLAANMDASRVTSEGTVLGTVAYIAPEQALGREPNPRSDLYALGAVLYEMLCGRPPFLGDDMVSVISQHLNTPPVAPRFHNDQIPPVVDSLVLRLLEKDPNARPATAGEVLELLREAQVAPEPGVAVLAHPGTALSNSVRGADWGRFVGRTTELEALRAAFDDSLSGHTRVVMVVGEPGIGKTRTVEELGVYASVRGAQVLWGHSYEGDIGVPYLPFVEALRTFVRELSDDGHLLDPDAGCAEVATIIPELRDRLPQLAVLPSLDGDAERRRLFEGVSSFLVAATRIRPLVIVLDDMHWSDKPSLLLLVHLARRVSNSRLLIVGTYRDVELERSHPLAETIATLRRERLYERVLLRGLPVAEVQAFIEAVGGQATPGEFAELIFRETEGNPFFVAEILRHLVETGAIRHEGDAWVGTPESIAENLPEGVREVIGRRLDGLSEGCNAALSVAAAMPGGFTVEVVGEVTGIDEDTMLDLLDEALGAQVVRERRERPGTYEFNHALIRQTLYGELSTPRRVRMHRRVGEALERSFADSIEAHLPELAFHAYEAAPGGDVAKAVDFARRAGDRAMSQTAYEEAARSYRMALQALDLVNDGDPRARIDLLLASARAEDRGGNDAACRTACLEAAELATLIGDAFRLGRSAVEYAGSFWYTAGSAQDPRRLQLYAAAEAALRDAGGGAERDSLLATVLSRHAAAFSFRDSAEHVRVVNEAIEKARESGDQYALASALQVKLTQRLPPEEHADVSREARVAVERSGDFSLMQSARLSRIYGEMSAQHRDELESEVAAYAEDAARSRVAAQLVITRQLQGCLIAIDGRYAEAERVIYESVQVARSSGTRELSANVGIGLAPVYRELGRLAAFEEATRRMVADTPGVVSWNCGFAQILCEIGKRDEASAIVAEIVASPEGVPDDVLWRYCVAMLAEVAAATSSHDSLVRLDEWMRSDTESRGRAVTIAANAYHGAFVRYCGLVAGALGRHSEAVADHEAALAEHQQMRAPGWEARSRYDLALALLGRNESGDVERAGTLLNEVVQRANQLGMTRLLEQALAAKLELQGVPSGAPASASIDILSTNLTIDRPELGQHADHDGQVTICFSDIVGYTAMTDRLGDHRTHELLRVHTAILRRELLLNRGVEVKSEGDGFMLAFRDPTDALGFAVAFQRSLSGHEWPEDVGALQVRMGVHRGAVIREADDFFGRTVIVGARVASAALGGEILVTDDVRAVTQDRFTFGEVRELALKGLVDSYPAAPLDWSNRR